MQTQIQKNLTGNIQSNIQKKRYERIDDIRGITLLSMILFHTVWDLVYIFDVQWDWFRTNWAYLWQQSICWSFILISGFCWSLGRRKFYRGLLVLGAGAVISLVTEIFTPGQRIQFGILTFLGSAMLLLIPLESLLKKIPPMAGVIGNFLLFAGMKEINDGYLGSKFLHLYVELPKNLYHQGSVATLLGFTDVGFYSADYFSILPWLFLFLTGYFLYRLAEQKEWLALLAEQKSWGRFWNFLGRKSLLIYMLHQPVVYGILLLLNLT